MLIIGENIAKLRKAKGWTQNDLAEEIDASRIMIGKYERGVNLPSAETLIKLADIFNVSIDYLVGKGLNSSFDKQMLNRLEDIERLTEEDKLRVFHYIDLVIRDAKARQAYS